MDRDKQIFVLGFGCGQVLQQEITNGIHEKEMRQYVNAIEWEAEKISEMYDKSKMHFPEIFNKTSNV